MVWMAIADTAGPNARRCLSFGPLVYVFTNTVSAMISKQRTVKECSYLREMTDLEKLSSL